MGTLQIGRTVLDPRNRLNAPVLRSLRSRGNLEIDCWHYSHGSTLKDKHATARALRNDLQGQVGDLVAVVWDGPAYLSGYYILQEADLSTIDAIGRFECHLALDYVGSTNDVVFESRLVGKVKTNDFSVTDSSSEPFLAPPPHDNYDPRHATTVARKIEGYPDLTVYQDIDFDIDPQYSVAPGDWYTGAATVQRREPLYPELGPIGGTDLFINDLEDIELYNGMVRFWMQSDASYVSFWDGTAWRDKPIFFVGEGSAAVTVWNTVTILDNRPEKCTLRFTGGATGRVTLDVSLRRGELGVSCLLTVDSATRLGVFDASLADMTVTSNRSVTTTADANGHKLVFVSTRTFSNVAADAYIYKDGGTRFDAFVGIELSGAPVGNQASALGAQYLAAVAENVRAVRR